MDVVSLKTNFMCVNRLMFCCSVIKLLMFWFPPPPIQLLASQKEPKLYGTGMPALLKVVPDNGPLVTRAAAGGNVDVPFAVDRTGLPGARPSSEMSWSQLGFVFVESMGS